jgi:hypothetical protein
MGNEDDVTPPNDPRKKSRFAKLSLWDRVDAVLLILWLGVATTYIGGLFWWEASIRTWVVLAVGAPILLIMASSIGIIAAHSPARHTVKRDSILWRWLAGLGRGLRASAGLAVGAFLGGLVGAGIAAAATLAELGQPLFWVISAVAFWVAISTVWWTVVAVIDMGRLSRVERVEAVRTAFPVTRDRRRGFPQFLAGFSSWPAVVLLGFVGLFMISQTWMLAIDMLGVA